MNKRAPSALTLTFAVLVVSMAVFALWPGLDLAVAGLFFDSGHFIGRTPMGAFFRRIFYDAPYVLLFGLLAAAVSKRFGFSRRGLSGRALLFLVASLALGPGLLVNGVLKEISHRPRPEQSRDFGGALPFRPFEAFDGGCAKNCSFVSGEAAVSAWTLAPALLALPQARVLAIAAALGLTAATSLLRMGFGGHYLSDVLMAVLLTVLVVLALHRWIFRKICKI